MLFVEFLRCVEKIRTIGVWYCLFRKICHVAKLPEIDSNVKGNWFGEPMHSFSRKQVGKL